MTETNGNASGYEQKFKGLQHCGASHVLDTVDLMVSLIHTGVIDVAGADAIKALWENQHRFRLKFKSFGERI